MATKYLALSEDTLLAEYVRLNDLKGLFEQRVAVNPDTLAVLIRDGKVAEAGPGGHFAVGGVWRTLKDALAGEHAIQLLLADLKPFQLTKSFTTLTKDGVEIVAEVTFDLQVDPGKPVNVLRSSSAASRLTIGAGVPVAPQGDRARPVKALGFMKAPGAVTKASVLSRIAPHLDDRVINAAVRRVDALELRGNRGLQDMVQADAMKESERLAGDIGLLVRAVSVNWGTNEAEQDEMLTRQRAREQAGLEEDARLLKRAVEREAETTVVQLKTALDVETVKVTTEDDLRRLILKNELAFIDQRETGVRRAQLDALKHELDLNRTQRVDGLNAQLEAEEHAIAMAKLGGQRGDVQMDVETRQAKHRITLARITNELRSVERETEEADRRHSLALSTLEADEMHRRAEREQQAQIDRMAALVKVELDQKDRDHDIEDRSKDREHGRRMDERTQAAAAEAEKMRLARALNEAQLLAVTAGFSPAVANVLVERARASAETDKMALMREMVQQAKDAQLQSEAQARHFFEHGMQGAVGVSQGVGSAAVAMAGVASGAAGMAVGGELTECPQCHQRVPVADRFCDNCGRALRQ